MVPTLWFTVATKESVYIHERILYFEVNAFDSPTQAWYPDNQPALWELRESNSLWWDDFVTKSGAKFKERKLVRKAIRILISTRNGIRGC